jgi:formylglycine-generating enzyme required for sulfatase activity
VVIVAAAIAVTWAQCGFRRPQPPGSGRPIPESSDQDLDGPAVIASRKADVLGRLKMLEAAPEWPTPLENWFPAIMIPPRPENNRRHSSCRIYEMRLPDGTPMQFVPYTTGPDNRDRCDRYSHGYFLEDTGPNLPEDEKDARLTIVSKRLLVSRTEVTRQQYDAVLSATNPVPLMEMRASDWTNGPAIMERLGMGAAEYGRRLPLLSQWFITGGKDLSEVCWRTVFAIRPFTNAPPGGMPAGEGIRFADVERFIAKLNSLCPPGCVFRLPTEAEWESICRQRDLRRFEGESPDDVCWSRENSGGVPHPVALKLQNYCGIFDMHGNVAEWCLDGFGPLVRPAFDPVIPVPADGSHVVRGGSWADSAEDCGSECRRGAGPNETGIGIRLVLEY